MRSLTKYLTDVGVVHVRKGLQDLPPLILGPHHKGVHGPLNVVTGTLGVTDVGGHNGKGRTSWKQDGCHVVAT